MVELCKQGGAYWTAWEEGRGPNQNIKYSSPPENGVQDQPAPGPSGPGTVLHSVLSKLGVTFTSTCSCRDHITLMNAWGPKGCRPNIHVIVGWLKEEAVRRRLPFSVTAANLLVQWSIHQAEKNLAKSEKIANTPS